jgi:hypothetical protein
MTGVHEVIHFLSKSSFNIKAKTGGRFPTGHPWAWPYIRINLSASNLTLKQFVATLSRDQ